MKAEDDWKRQGLYMGPAVSAAYPRTAYSAGASLLICCLVQFDNLDEGVQAEFENFLEERGINSALALTIPDLAEWKEQK